MQYKYLRGWAEEFHQTGLFFREVLRWRDQYALLFNNNALLQINLQSNDPFCFFSEREILNWQPAVELAVMQEHLHRAKLVDLSYIEEERIIFLDFTKPDPFKNVQEFRLYLELIPQFTNIILTKKESDKWLIVDCSKKVSLSENHYRQLIPAVFYELPPRGYKNESLEIEFPLCFADSLKISENCNNGYDQLNPFMESLYYDGYLNKLSDQTKNEKLKKIVKQLAKKEQKLIKQKNELDNAVLAEKWKQLGELLKSHLHLIKKGMSEITLVNYYSENLEETTVKLKDDKSPAWNVDFYFKKYRKALNGKQKIIEQITHTENEIKLLKKSKVLLEDEDIVLPGEFVLPQTVQIKIAEKLTRITVNDDWELIVGRNSKENDYITTKLAKPDDWWFHTRIFKGTHVLLRNFRKQNLPRELMIIACRLAAGYSKAAKSANVPVDYTQIRYVRKPRNSAAGFVIYTHQKTLFVDPLDIRSASKIINDKFGNS